MENFRGDISINRMDQQEGKKKVDYEDSLLQSRKEIMNLCLYVQLLEKQLSRLV